MKELIHTCLQSTYPKNKNHRKGVHNSVIYHKVKVNPMQFKKQKAQQILPSPNQSPIWKKFKYK